MTTKEEYIDLGLPSGNLWKIKTEEDYFTYDEAVEKFGNNLPSKDDFKELYDNCTWVWDEENKGVLFTSKINGEKIFFKANGCRIGTNIHYVGSLGSYWSSTAYDASLAYDFIFDSSGVYPAIRNFRYNGRSVRLVQKPNTTINKPTNKNTMTTKEMIAVMTAFDEGKEIEQKVSYSDNDWEYIYEPSWDWDYYDYRIKPEEPQPKYRPYQNAEEMIEAIKIHGDWLKLKEKRHNNSVFIKILSFTDGGFRCLYTRYEGASPEVSFLWYQFDSELFTWLDGTPFGIKE